MAEIKINPDIHSSWGILLKTEFEKNYFKELKNFLLEEKKHYVVYPRGNEIFNAFNSTPFDSVKVVLLGQDPYHGTGQAHGLSFSVPDGIALPPSLQNIFKELASDIGLIPTSCGNLLGWARQGVLLLNATLTVRANMAGSHQKKGWEVFTDEVIRQVSKNKEHIVFLLWGNYARQKKFLIDESKHLILEAAHPSPFSAYNGFFGSRHFSKCNTYLSSHGITPIDWSKTK